MTLEEPKKQIADDESEMIGTKGSDPSVYVLLYMLGGMLLDSAAVCAAVCAAPERLKG